MKITSDTTLHQLSVERARLGVTQLMVMTHPEQIYIACYVESEDLSAIGGGETMADAIDEALRKLEVKIGERILETDRTS